VIIPIVFCASFVPCAQLKSADEASCRWRKYRSARDGGVQHSDELATAYCGPERAALGRTYLRENIKYRLGDREAAGLRMYYELAEKHGVVERAVAPEFYQRF